MGIFTTSINVATNQDGHRTVADVWVDNTQFLVPALGDTAGGWLGLVFDFNAQGRTTEAGRGLPIVPPLVTLSSLVFREFISIGLVHTGHFLIHYLDELAPANYSTALLPGNRGETFVGTRPTLIGGGEFSRPTTTLTFANPVAIITTMGLENEAATGRANMYAMMQNSNWSGRLALSINYLGNGAGRIPMTFRSGELTVGIPTLNTIDTPFHTGHNVGGIGRQGRARHCARSGLPANTADLIPDGYLEGAYHVLPDWWEPEDRSGLDYNLPSTEGEVDDAITGGS